jgi:hypothetical protein
MNKEVKFWDGAMRSCDFGVFTANSSIAICLAATILRALSRRNSLVRVFQTLFPRWAIDKRGPFRYKLRFLIFWLLCGAECQENAPIV